MKWNVNDIVDFLNIYEDYPILWNIKHPDYSNSKLKDEFLSQLYNQLAEKGLVEGFDIKQLKAKIKSIKDVFRQELNKIERSKKSGSGTEDIYKPKLAWFKTASYLSEVMSTRKTTSNLVSNLNIYIIAIICNYYIIGIDMHVIMDTLLAMEKNTMFFFSNNIITIKFFFSQFILACFII